MSTTNPSLSTGAKIASAVVLGIIAFGVWVALPYFLPVWRWQHLDGWPWITEPEHTWAAVAQKKNIPESKLRTEFDLIIRYAKRRLSSGAEDPYPWQIMKSTPAWIDHMPDTDEDETNTLVRVALISDRDGTAPSSVWVGQAIDEVYFKCKAWRFPAGSFGQKSNHPVIVYRGSTFERLTIGQGQTLNAEAANYESDDTWEDRADGFGQPTSE